MKLNLNLFIFTFLVLYLDCEKLVPMKYVSQKFPAKNNYWYDLLEQEIRCPNDGVMKNFILRKDNEGYYFELECYSSDKEEADYGEPIIKRATLTSTLEATLSISNKDVSTLNNFEMDCTPEYGLNGFKIFKIYEQNREKLKKANFCKPTKCSYVSKKNIKTQEKTTTSTNLDCFVDILVGSTEEENDNVVGYPLRSFQFMVEGNNYNNFWNYNYNSNRKCYFVYSYGKLKNMGKFKDERLKQFEELRNKNTQVD